MFLIEDFEFLLTGSEDEFRDAGVVVVLVFVCHSGCVLLIDVVEILFEEYFDEFGCLVVSLVFV